MHPKQIKIHDKAALDWSCQDIQLAEETGVSRERIRQLRKKYNAPAHPYNKRPRQFAQRCEAILRAKEQLVGRSIGEIERILGFQLGGMPIRRFLRANVVLGKRENHVPWETLVNWQLADRDIGGIWGVRQSRVAEFRKKLKVGPPVFGPNLSNHHALVRAERKKAEN